ncbi:MAG: FeoB-associated Cys-rich membrane protein [Clostridium sp.]|nr:FeoB-associated Cys-rich membrane protein [Clostridium sp.]
MNLPTLIILLVLITVVGAIIRKMIRDKRAGKGCSGCGGGCSGCHSSASCHSAGSTHS